MLKTLANKTKNINVSRRIICYFVLFTAILINPKIIFAQGPLDNFLAERITNLSISMFAATREAASWLLWASGQILNSSIEYGVRNMGNIVQDSEAIHIGWTVLRDMINLLFIFGLLYLSLNIILKGWEDKSRSMLKNIIIAALFINFSFFLTSVAIDLSNVLGLRLADSMTGCQYEGTTNISNCFMNSLRLSTLYNDSSVSTGQRIEISSEMFLQIIFLVIASFVFFATALLIFTRMIMLLLLLVLSPIAFIGQIFPQLQTLSTKWTDELVKNLIFLPLFFVLLYVTYVMLLANTDFWNVVGINTNTQNYSDIINRGGSADVLIRYVLTIGFLIASLVLSKDYSAKASGAMTKWAGNVTLGGGAKVGRRIGGGLGQRLANSDTAKKWAESDSALTRLTGKALVKGGAKAAKGSWDIRSQSQVAQALKASGMDLGDARSTSFSDRIAKKKKKIEEDDKLFKREYSNEEKAALDVDNINSTEEFINSIKYLGENGEKEKQKDVDTFKKLAEAINANTTALNNAEYEVLSAQQDLDGAQNSTERKEAQRRLRLANSNYEKTKKQTDGNSEKLNKDMDKLKEKVLKEKSLAERYNPNTTWSEFKEGASTIPIPGNKLKEILGDTVGTVLTSSLAKNQVANNIRKESAKSSSERQAQALLDSIKNISGGGGGSGDNKKDS
jgi:hypothetical protein